MPRGLLVRRLPPEPAPLDLSVKAPSESALSKIANIENRIGDYVCRLCDRLYTDPFGLAAHRCDAIARVDYRCPECGKRFNCPANLASHRRWHRPWICKVCGKGFEKRKSLDEHSNLCSPHLPQKRRIGGCDTESLYEQE